MEILTLVINFFNTVYLAIERSRGHAKKILKLNMAVIVVKLALSAFFVYVVQGGLILIAVATLAGQLLLLGFAVVSMRRDAGAFRFGFRNIRWKKDTVLPVLNLSYPVTAEKMLFAAGKVVVNSMSGMYGGMTVGALGINSATIALLLGYGYTKLTLLLNVSRVFLHRVPVLWAFQQFTTLGAEAVGMTMMISNVCTGVTAIAVAIPVIARIRHMKNK